MEAVSHGVSSKMFGILISQTGSATGEMECSINLAFALLSFAGLLKCVQLIRRPTTNTLCIMPLLLFCLAIFIFTLWQFSGIELPSLVDPLIRLGLGSCYILGFLLGCIGLVQYSVRKGKYQRGLIPGVIGILLCGSLSAIMGYAVLRQQVLIKPEPNRITLLDQPKTFPEWNLKLQMPASPWSVIDAKEINSEALCGSAWKSKGVILVVVGKRVGSEGLDVGGFVELMKVLIRGRAENVISIKEEQETNNSIEGIRLEVLAMIDGKQTFFSNWIAVQGEYCYQINVTGFAPMQEYIQESARTICGGVRVISPVSDPSTSDKKNDESVSEQPAIVFEDLNFRFSAPAKPWGKIDIKKINSEATCGWMHAEKQILIIVIAEKAGIGVMDKDTLRDAALYNMRQGASGTTVLSESQEEHDGIDGLRVSYSGSIRGLELYYSNWVGERNGYAYQVLVGGPVSEKSEIDQIAPELTKGFSQIDANRSYTVQVENYRSEPFGYEIDAQAAHWDNWDVEDIASELPCADSGAFSINSGYVVIPVRLEGLDPSFEQLAHVLAYLTNREFIPSRLTKTGELHKDDFVGRYYEFSDASNEPLTHLRYMVLKNKDMAYLIQGWYAGDNAGNMHRVDEIFEHTRFFPVAREDAELSPRQLKQQELVCDALGHVFWMADKPQEAFQMYRRAMEYAPQNETYLDSAANCLDVLGKYEEGQTILEEHIGRFPDSAVLHANLAWHCVKSGQLDEGFAYYKKAFQEGLQDIDYLGFYITSLARNSRFEEAHTSIDDWIQRWPDQKQPALILLVDVLDLEDKHEEAIDLLAHMLQENTWTSEIGLLLAQQYYGAGRFVEQIDECERLIHNSVQTAEVYNLKGLGELKLKWYPAAKESFEKAAELDPEDTDYRDNLIYVSGLLGEGENSLCKKPIEPVVLPASVLAEMKKCEVCTEASQDDCSLYRVTLLELLPEGVLKSTVRTRVHILSRKGVIDYSTIVFDFNALTEEIYINDLSVYASDGARLATGDPNTYYVTSDSSDALASYDKKLNVPIPGMEPGSFVEWTVTLKTANSDGKWPYRAYYFDSYDETLFRAVGVRGGLDHLSWETRGAIETQVVDDSRIWSMRNLPLFRSESMALEPSQWCSRLVLADQGDSWDSLVHDYLERIADRLVVTERVRQLSEEITTGLTGTEEQVLACARYVRDHLAYNGIEFGERGQMPNPVDTILDNRYGDCKDFALLFYQLLRSQNIPAHLALVSYSDTPSEQLPSLDCFDHMVVFVPGYRGGMPFDCTPSYSGFSSLPQYGLLDETILVLEPGNPYLRKAGSQSPGDSNTRLSRDVRIESDGDALIHETMIMHGSDGNSFRYCLQGKEQSEMIQFIEESANSYQRISIDTLKIENLDSPDEPLVIHMVYRVQNAFHPAGEYLAGRLPAVWEQWKLLPSRVPARRSPFLIKLPDIIESSVRLTLPDGYVLENQDQLNQDGKVGWLEWSVACSNQDGVPILVWRHIRQPGVYPSEQYESFVNETERALDSINVSITLLRVSSESHPPLDVSQLDIHS